MKSSMQVGEGILLAHLIRARDHRCLIDSNVYSVVSYVVKFFVVEKDASSSGRVPGYSSDTADQVYFMLSCDD